MSVKTQTVIDSITDVTKDYDRERFKLVEIARWLNQGAGQIAEMHPRAASQYVSLTLDPGSRQDLRSIDSSVSWIRLHELLCNASGGEPAGDAIRMVSRSALDAAVRSWRSKPSSIVIREYTMDEREPFTFDVYPPAAGGAEVYALASVRPAAFCVLSADGSALADPNEVIPLADGFEVPLIDYTLFRLFNKDVSDPTYQARAAMHLSAFQLAMGVETKDAKQQ